MSTLDRRIGLLFCGFLVLLLLALARTVQLGTLQGGKLRRAAATQQVVREVVPARRGTIVDAKGRQLAVSEPAADVSATPYLIKDPVRTAARIAPILQTDPYKLASTLARKDTGFVYLARQLPVERSDRIAKLKIEGITLDPAEKRNYPLGFMASQVLGSVGIDGKGLGGLELQRDHALRGVSGERRTVRDALGETLELSEERNANPGARLQLTLDSAIQDRAESVLEEVGRTYKPRGASVIVTNPQTNAVIAMANWPRTDANNPGGSPQWAQRNRATGYTYEPGSTFKAFTVAGALMDGKVAPQTAFDLPPQIQVADRTIGEAHERGPVTLTTAQILAQSSNVGAIKIGQTIGATRFDHWVRRFGFGRRTGVDLPGEERGIQPTVREYSGSSMGNLPIGQGELVTPMQMATAYSAIANGGVLRRPHLIKQVDGRPVRMPRGRRILSEQVSAQLRTMLEDVLAPGGTASEVVIPGYVLAGKTGTANKVDPKTHEYSKSHVVASFVGFAPAKHPELLISVMVDDPQGGSVYGSTVAAPAFKQIAAYALQYLGIAPK